MAEPAPHTVGIAAAERSQPVRSSPSLYETQEHHTHWAGMAGDQSLALQKVQQEHIVGPMALLLRATSGFGEPALAVAAAVDTATAVVEAAAAVVDPAVHLRVMADTAVAVCNLFAVGLSTVKIVAGGSGVAEHIADTVVCEA